jgi:trehalose/maltose hydrolase-like predicted phosphorylase
MEPVGIFMGIRSRNMAVELDSRHPLLPKTGWENEDFTLILRERKMEIFADTSAFNAGVKEKNTKINLNRACQNFYGNLH